MTSSTEPDADMPDCFVGTQTEPIPDGGILTIAFCDPGRGGTTVEVEASDADDPTAKEAVQVPLRGNGRGTAQLIVPVGWGGVVLRAAGSRARRVDVAIPP